MGAKDFVVFGKNANIVRTHGFSRFSAYFVDLLMSVEKSRGLRVEKRKTRFLAELGNFVFQTLRSENVEHVWDPRCENWETKSESI